MSLHLSSEAQHEHEVPFLETDGHDLISQDDHCILDSEGGVIQLSSNALSATAGRLYVSHFLSTWNSRVFEFGAVLYLATMFPHTLLPMSVYALCRGMAAVIFAPAVGRYIDTGERLHVVRASIVLQRIAVAVSCAILWLMAVGFADHPPLKATLLGMLSMIACVEKLASMMNLLAVERDWVVVVAGQSEHALRELNSQMRRIDLICKLVGPFIISIIDSYSTRFAIVVNLGMNLFSLPIEYYTIRQVYRSTLALTRAKPVSNEAQIQSWSRTLALLRRQICEYVGHPVVRPSLAGALLYLTVLSFSGQMVTYLLAMGFTSTQVALARTVSVVFEISATWIAPWMMSRVGAVRSGIWFLSSQMLCLGIGTVLFSFLPSTMGAAGGLVAGTVLSRVGLWGFDLSSQVIVQEEVEAERRGSFAAIEASLQNIFELCSFAITIVFSRPEQFHWPVYMSCAAVYVAGVLYAWFVRNRRGHLIHFCERASSSKRRWPVNRP
jgi:solute carrier family 40 (iron-regulated transporter), member 1